MSAPANADAPAAPADQPSFQPTVGWAFFLASSWTWCIGMFLPVLLVEDFGLWGWIAFAIPNVLGALAVGLLPLVDNESASPLSLWERGRGRGTQSPLSLWERGRGRGTASRVRGLPPFAHWALAFSLATIAFHIAFLAWITPMVFAPFLHEAWVRTIAGATAALLLLAGASGLARLRDRGFRAAAVLVYALSIAFFALAALTTDGRAFAAPSMQGAEPARALLAVAPALALGFLLCPQLDLTLRRARSATTGSSRSLAFALGFGVLFLGMITASLFYASGWVGGWINSWIIAHFAGQSLFTMSAHLREVRERAPAASALGPWTLAAFALGLAAGLLANIDGAGRLIYQGFLGLYAIVFPAFVWTLIVRSRRSPTPGPTLTALVAIALAAPVFAAGQLTQRWWLAGAGVAAAIAIPALSRAVRSGRIA